MLSNLPRHSSREFSATQAFLTGKGLSSRIVEPRARPADARFKSVINALYGGGLYLAYMEYGADVEIDAPAERGDYGFSIPFGGVMASTAYDDTLMACSRDQTVLASPGRPQRMFLAGDAQRLALSIGQDRMRRRLQTLIGREVKGRIVFDPLLDLTQGAGAAIASAMQLIVTAQDGGCDVFADPLRETHFEEVVLSTLLLYQPHSHQGLLERPAPCPASRDVKRAIDYIHAHLEQPISLEILVAVSGVPGRTLNEHFRQFTGLAPMAYLRRERLHAARRLLESGEATVTDAAMRYGFLHLGRFASTYRAAFGEPPSAALARSAARL